MIILIKNRTNIIKYILSTQLKKITYSLAISIHTPFLNLLKLSACFKIIKTKIIIILIIIHFFCLGYAPDKYFFDKKTRDYRRKALNIKKDEIVFVTSTRLNKKKIKKYIDLVSSLKDKGYKVRYIMIGFLNDDYGSYLMNYVSTLKNKDIFNCYPFSDDKFINEIYCASDVGIWTKCATLYKSLWVLDCFFF